jgi:hypothetical protein
MISSRLLRWFIAVPIGLAAAFTVWAIAVMASGLMREDGHAPWALYLLWSLFLAMFWSGLSLLRWRTTLATIVLLLATLYALPLGLLIIVFRMVDD